MSKLVSTAADILAVKDLRSEKVFIEEWDQEVIVREFSGRELQSVMKLDVFKGGGDETEFAATDAAKVCVIAIKDKDGKRIFTDDQAEDLADKSVKAVLKVFQAALRISGLTADEQEKEKNA